MRDGRISLASHPVATGLGLGTVSLSRKLAGQRSDVLSPAQVKLFACYPRKKSRYTRFYAGWENRTPDTSLENWSYAI